MGLFFFLGLFLRDILVFEIFRFKLVNFCVPYHSNRGFDHGFKEFFMSSHIKVVLFPKFPDLTSHIFHAEQYRTKS